MDEAVLDVSIHAARVSIHAGCIQRTHILALLINSTEAGNLLRGNDALHAMLGARTRARVQLVLGTMMFICLIARLLVQASPQSY